MKTTEMIFHAAWTSVMGLLILLTQQPPKADSPGWPMAWTIFVLPASFAAAALVTRMVQVSRQQAMGEK
jgi:membrane protein implicated in regulation of membrane protease activity